MNNILKPKSEEQIINDLKYLNDEQKNSAFKAAVFLNDLNIVKIFLLSNINVNLHNEWALRTACEKDNTEMIKLLIDHGANIHSCNEQPLKMACVHGNIEIAKLLISMGAEVNIEFGYPLRCASKWGHIKIVKLLLDAGARDTNSQAFVWAYENHHYKIAKLLQKYLKRQKSKL